MSQLTYTQEMPVAFAGMLADGGPKFASTGINQETGTTEIPFGAIVVQGTTENGAKLPSAAGDATKIRGVALHGHNYEQPLQVGSLGPKPGVVFSVLEKGRVWVTVETAVAIGDRAFVRYAGTGQKGAVRNATVAGEMIELKGARFRTATTGPGLALLEIDANVIRAA